MEASRVAAQSARKSDPQLAYQVRASPPPVALFLAQVKAGTLAVRVETSLADRVCSLPADGKKLVAAAMGKHHL